MTESGYTSKLRILVKEFGVYPLKIALRHESGIADCWYSGRAKDMWVEWKYYASLPKVIDLCSGAKPKLSKHQQRWLTDRHHEGRNVWIGVACADGAVLSPGLEWLQPMTREEFLVKCVSQKAVASLIADTCNGLSPDGNNPATLTLQ